jgi:hypothetical protein
VFNSITMQPVSEIYQTKNLVLEQLEQNPNLYVEENFVERMRALDMLEFQILDGVEPLRGDSLVESTQENFWQRIEALRLKLEAANQHLFNRLVENIQANDRSMLKRYLRKAEREIDLQTSDDEVGYDEMDLLVNGLLEVPIVPSEPDERDAGMMFYQPTPARIILTIIDKLQMQADDIFYDLGSGIGHVPILINLLTDVRTKGVELEESYVRYSDACLKKLGITDVEFIQADARDVAYDGTVFYMYTPFTGELLQQVLTKLETTSKEKSIRVCTYGPCTLQVSKQSWLQSIYLTGKREGSLGIFVSL